MPASGFLATWSQSAQGDNSVRSSARTVNVPCTEDAVHFEAVLLLGSHSIEMTALGMKTPVDYLEGISISRRGI